MERKRIANTIGTVAGIIMIGIGIYVMNPETFLLGERDSTGMLIEFGADFYTEIYAMTYSAANAVQRAYTNICNAIGWLIIVLGAFDICYFISREEEFWFNSNSEQSVEETPDSAPNAPPITNKSLHCPNCENKISSFPCYFCGYFPNTDEPTNASQALPDGSWICSKCNTQNNANYGQCKKCGQYRK